MSDNDKIITVSDRFKSNPDFLMLILEQGVPTMAYTAVNAVADVTGISDEIIYAELINGACELGFMPGDKKSVFHMLEAFHFYRQPGREEKISASEFLKKMENGFADPDGALILSNNKNFSAVIPCKNKGDAKNQSRKFMIRGIPHLYNIPMIDGIWIHWADNEDHSPRKRRRPNRKSENVLYSKTETEYFKPFQPNPKKNNIGDCVIRAMTGVFETDWEEVIRALSTSDLLCSGTINSLNVFVDFLIKRGLERHSALGNGREKPTGIEFCRQATDMYHNGERLFVKVYRNHAVAVLPTMCDDGIIRYKAHDSWNCTHHKFGNYWIRRSETLFDEPKDMPDKTKINAEEDGTVNIAVREPIESFAVSDKIHHPNFGDGIIEDISGSEGSEILTVCFESVGIKKISASWTKVHCSVCREK